MLVTTNYAKKKYSASTIYQSYSVLWSLPLWQCYGLPRVLGIPIPKTLVIWASPATLTLTQIAKVIWERDAHITARTPAQQLFLSVPLYFTVRNIMICHGIQSAHASLRDLFDHQGDFTNIDREIDNLDACKVHWLYTSFYLFLYSKVQKAWSIWWRPGLQESIHRLHDAEHGCSKWLIRQPIWWLL